ncbi:MAG: iron-containing alcohol dehydrogenase [Oscillospiraceae bacterium]|nr:iron-containing alcohol dehydrogenase [Oscillospiraceae bacterium]
MDVFCCNTKIISGTGAVSALAEFGAGKVFLVSDPYFVKNGTADRVLAATKAQYTEVFDGVQPDPSVELAAEGTAKLKKFEPDLVVALGGGSAIDCAKAMRFFAGEKNIFAAIPTTSGSGSEVTDFAILTYGETKHPLVDPKLRPDAAILDDELLAQLPKSLIADSGFDVLSHALEACAATDSGTITDCLAKEAFVCAFNMLPLSYAGQTQVRLKVHEASCLAGMAFTQAGLGICHALAHALGGMFHIPHGRLNAVLLPAVVGVNSSAAGRKYAEFAKAAGVGGGADTIIVRNLKNSLVRLRRQLNLPDTLIQAGADAKILRSRQGEIIKTALQDPCCRTNPVPVTESLLKQVLDEVTGRG